MANWFTKLTNNPINEQIESFRPKNEKQTDHLEGEGIEDLQTISGYGNLGLNSFNNFYSNYINKQFSNEIEKIKQYRQIAQMPEIADVVEDATLECTQEDQNGDMISLSIVDDELKNNDNIVNNLQKEFRELFYERINLKEELWNLFYTYFIDGRFYYERLINTKRKTDGIIGIKRLPTETMDYAYDPSTGEILAYFQYITGTPKKPLTMEEAQKDPNVIVFYPDQI
ncbi:MAG TPA: portal protein, partial [Bacteroidales bacterium]|nr:portal protein [Bacteroidales bacterium]